MVIRTALIGVLALAASAYAQPPAGARGRGPGGPVPRLIGAEAGMPGRVVKNAPFSADIITETTQTLPDGNHIKRTNTVKVFRDSEGRTRREQSLDNLNGLAVGANGGNIPQVAFINDPVARTNYALDMTNRTATKSAHPRPGAFMGRGAGSPPDGSAPRSRVAPPDGAQGNTSVQPRSGAFGGPGRGRNRQNVRTESLGKQTIEGVQAEGTRTTMTIPAGQIGNEQPIQVVDETWYSPDLQTVLMRKHSDPRTGDIVTRYTNVSRAEPSQMLFQPPADFKISESGRVRGNQ